MKIWDFDLIKKTGENIHYNDNIIVCQDLFTDTELSLKIHTHTFYEIMYVFHGQGVEISNKKSYILNQGDISITPPGVIHGYYSTDNLAISNICIIPNEYQKNILDKITRSSLTTQEYQKEFEMLFSLLAHNLDYQSHINPDSYINIIFNLVIKSVTNQSKIGDKWNKLILYINDNFNTVTLNEAAQICNFSTSYFCRSFKKDFSMTFLQYIENIRIEKAKTFLLISNLGIYDIISMVGFGDSTRFFKKFKENVGLTPRQYRQNMKNKL